MCREKGAVKHDYRLDCLAQGVNYFTDALSISAYQSSIERKREDWADMLEGFLNNPTQATNHLVMGFSLEQRRQARQLEGKKSVSHWVWETTTINGEVEGVGVDSQTSPHRHKSQWRHKKEWAKRTTDCQKELDNDNKLTPPNSN